MDKKCYVNLEKIHILSSVECSLFRILFRILDKERLNNFLAFITHFVVISLYFTRIKQIIKFGKSIHMHKINIATSILAPMNL